MTTYLYTLYTKVPELKKTTMSSLALHKLKKKSPSKQSTSKQLNRFDGLSEEKVKENTLPDYLRMNLDIIVIGINPGLMSAHRRRYYAGPGNHFYKLLHSSGLLPILLNYEQDYKLCEYGIGLTNIVSRATKSSSELSKSEIKEGAAVIKEKINHFKPKVAVFNGKCIYEVFMDKTSKQTFRFGLQPEFIGNTAVWVVPSSSARCSNFPRMVDKLHFYVALKKYLQYLKGEILDAQISEFVFEGKCRPAVASTSKMWRRKNVSAFQFGGRIANKDTFCMDTSEESIACGNNEFFEHEHQKGDDDSGIERKSEDSDSEKQNGGNSDQKCQKSSENESKTSDKRENGFNFVSLIKQRILEKQQSDQSLPTKMEKSELKS